ncbi:hypothetical protein L1987_75124 [Smallanthus sonchifolius]|uniref:Uncharacterized protein n=1 Tax=Smallanthus sonchifolius TaxID=185202 RepID=A0ACB9A5L3_9ASTR|nr:hypothetical protein L1987_75124 [Smallanthus sonchifolius]
MMLTIFIILYYVLHPSTINKQNTLFLFRLKKETIKSPHHMPPLSWGDFQIHFNVLQSLSLQIRAPSGVC